MNFLGAFFAVVMIIIILYCAFRIDWSSDDFLTDDDDDY